MLVRRGVRGAVRVDPLLVVALAGLMLGVLLIWPQPAAAQPSDPPSPPPFYGWTPSPAATPTPTPPPSVSASPSESGPVSPSGSATSPSTASPSLSPIRPRFERYHDWRPKPPDPPAATTEAAAVSPSASPPPRRPPQVAPDPGDISEMIARGLIFGGSAGFVVSVIGMMLVGWIRRRV